MEDVEQKRFLDFYLGGRIEFIKSFDDVVAGCLG